MFDKQYYRQSLKLLLGITLLFVSSIPVKAEKVNPPKKKQQDRTSQSIENKFWDFANFFIPRFNKTPPNQKPPKSVYFRQPERQGTPQGTRPAGSRNGCSVGEMPLTALVPIAKKTDDRQLRWGLTTKEHPTFWFYVPDELKSIKNAKFSLRDRQKQTIYETQLQLTDAPGVISVSLPPSAPSLEVGEWYKYYLFVDANCDSNGFLQKELATAWVKREAISKGYQTQLERISPLQRGLFYAQNGIWYDAMASFAEVKDAPGRNLEWVQMLELVGLGKIANVPVVDCCESSKQHF